MSMQLQGRLTMLVYTGTEFESKVNHDNRFQKLIIRHDTGELVLDLDREGAAKLYRAVRNMCREIDAAPARKPEPILDDEELVDLHNPPKKTHVSVLLDEDGNTVEETITEK